MHIGQIYRSNVEKILSFETTGILFYTSSFLRNHQLGYYCLDILYCMRLVFTTAVCTIKLTALANRRKC